MVYAPPRPNALQSASKEKRRTVGAYGAALDGMDRAHAYAVREYVAALYAECAAHRARARRAETALEQATGGAR